MPESDVCRRQILTSKVDPRAVRIKICAIIIQMKQKKLTKAFGFKLKKKIKKYFSALRVHCTSMTGRRRESAPLWRMNVVRTGKQPAGFVPCKFKRQWLLTCFLALHGRFVANFRKHFIADSDKAPAITHNQSKIRRNRIKENYLSIEGSFALCVSIEYSLLLK